MAKQIYNLQHVTTPDNPVVNMNSINSQDFVLESVSVYLLDIFIVEIYSFYLNNVIFIKQNKILLAQA
jgi:hypothetical protein